MHVQFVWASFSKGDTHQVVDADFLFLRYDTSLSDDRI